MSGSFAARVAGSADSSAASRSSIFWASFVVVNHASFDGTSRATRARARATSSFSPVSARSDG